MQRFARPRAGILVALLFPTILLGTDMQAPLQASTVGQPSGGGGPGRSVAIWGSGLVRPSLVPPPARTRGATTQAATFIVDYGSLPSEAREAFAYAVSIWAAQLSSPVPIRVRVDWRPLGGLMLGYAGTVNTYRNFPGAPVTDTFYPIAIANKLTGHDLYPDAPDIDAAFSSTIGNWYFGTDGEAPEGSYDFVSVALHELGHGLGFVGSARVDATQGRWGASGSPWIYDLFVVNSESQSLTDTDLFPNPSPQLGALLTSDDLYFAGENAVAAAGGEIPKLHAPSRWQEASSYVHLDEAVYEPGTPNSLMTPLSNLGEVNHDPGPIVLGMFQDMGWTVSGSPVPGDVRVLVPLVMR